MQPQQMILLEDPPPPGVVPIWNTLDEEQRAEIVTRLARLIAKALAQLEDKLHE
jgi:hypothetical protein